MKRCVAVEAPSLKGQHPSCASTSGKVNLRDNKAVEQPPKPRSHTVATFLSPQLPPAENAAELLRSRGSTAELKPLPPPRVQDRRNALVENHRGMVAAEGPEGLSGSAAALNGSTASETASTLTYTDGEPLNSRPTESSASLGRPREAASRRLSENLMCYARASQQAPRGSPEAAKAAATTATSSRSLRTANGTEAPHAASPFESFAVPKSQRAEGKEAELTSHTSRTAASSTRQSRSVQERSASRRGASAISRPQAKLEPPAVAGPGKSKDAENAKVGFAKRSERERMGPSSCFLSATRTRESLLVPGEGRAYHLGVQHGELHSRILTVGHAGRADWLAERFLDSQMRTLSLKSNRNFRLHSGYYRRKPVSIVAIGMGAPMMDVLVREASYITEGPLAIVRLGTCTLLDQELKPGSIVVASPGSLGCYTNYAYFDGTAVEYSRTEGLWHATLGAELKPYTITRPCAADPELSRLIYRHAASQAPDSVFEGLNVSAETFYSCQAREDLLFRDENEDLLETLLLCGAQTMEMETHQLLHLASRRIELMKAAAVHIGVTSRTNDHFMHPITPTQLSELVAIAGKACLDALVDVTI